jgi:CAAX protease family protein
MSATSQAVIPGRQQAQAVRPGPLAFVRRHPVAVFLVLVFALTWALEIPWIESTDGPLKFDFPLPLLFVMGWMPGFAAILVTAAISGRAGIRVLLGRLLIWRLGLRWYLVPILGSAALWIAALALDPLLGGTGITLPTLSIDLLIGVAVSLVVIFLINSEEIGWRGFAIPRL